MTMENFNPYSDIPTSMATPPLKDETEEYRSISLVRELSPQEPLREIMANLEGKVWDKKKKDYVAVPGVKPLMNQEGRDMFFHFATAITNPIVTMSYFSKDYKMIHSLVMMQIRKASANFHLHYKDYGITRKTKIPMIIDKLMIVGLSSFYKAIQGGDRKAATSNISENINTLYRDNQPQPQIPQNKKSFMGRMNPFSR